MLQREAKLAFNWETFFKRYGIRYVTSGRNTKSGEYSVPCPWCNQTSNKDPSEHLGINPDTGMYSCWRNNKHRGKNPVYLIKHLLNISFEEACEIYGVTRPDPSELETALQKLRQRDVLPVKPDKSKSIAFPENTYPVKASEPFTPSWTYLCSRGWGEDHIQELVDDYGLRCAITGPWAGRVLLPVTYQGQLVSWTGRAINDTPGRLRYLNTGKEESVIKHTDCLYLFDEVMSEAVPNLLYVLEGPFDALKLDFYGKKLGIRAVAMFTNTLSDNQKLLVSNLSDKFKEVRIMLDTGWFHQSLSLASQITASNVRAQQMIPGFKDVGEMTESDINTHFHMEN